MNDWQIGIVFALGNLAPLLTWHLARTIYVNPNCAGRLSHRDINLFHAPVYIPKGVFRIGENWFCLFGRSHICICCVLVPRPERDDDIWPRVGSNEMAGRSVGESTRLCLI